MQPWRKDAGWVLLHRRAVDGLWMCLSGVVVPMSLWPCPADPHTPRAVPGVQPLLLVGGHRGPQGPSAVPCGGALTLSPRNLLRPPFPFLRPLPGFLLPSLPFYFFFPPYFSPCFSFPALAASCSRRGMLIHPALPCKPWCPSSATRQQPRGEVWAVLAPCRAWPQATPSCSARVSPCPPAAATWLWL